MEAISLAASLATLLEVAKATKDLGERLSNAPKEIAAFAKDISRLSNSFYLLAEAISDPTVQQQYRTSERIKNLGAGRSCTTF